MLEKLPESVGHALRNIRTGPRALAVADNELTGTNAVIAIFSSAFGFGGVIPARYTADGEGVSPPLQWTNVPMESKAIVVLVEDADSPSPQPMVHAIVWNLPGCDGSLAEGALNSADEQSERRDDLKPQSLGRNPCLSSRYIPLDPSPGQGVHRYAFEVLALDTTISFDSPPDRSALFESIRGHVIAKGFLMGKYKR